MAQTVQACISMQSHSKHSRSAGFSLIEMLIVVVIIGLVMLFTYPRAGKILDHTQVKGARTAIVNKLNAARTMARTSNRIAVLRVSGNQLFIELDSLIGTGKDTVGGFVPLATTYGVTVTVSGPANDSVSFNPRGMLKYGGGRKYIVTRNGVSDSVLVNGYGRITR
jgi:prepilin-type N-terminal cleavage/methylation domain-containing protein